MLSVHVPSPAREQCHAAASCGVSSGLKPFIAFIVFIEFMAFPRGNDKCGFIEIETSAAMPKIINCIQNAQKEEILT